MTEELANTLRAVHVLGATVWVGGMVFALFVLRPSLGLLPPGLDADFRASPHRTGTDGFYGAGLLKS